MCAFFAKLLNVPTEPPAKEFNDPVFLIGLMRSGTTLLMNTLSEHPQLLKAGFELNHMWTEIGGAPCSSVCVERLSTDVEETYQNNVTAYFENYIQQSKSVLRHLSRWSQKRFYGSGRVFYDWDDVRLMNKSPHLSNKISYLNKMYPKSKFVVIVRSPFGQAASQKMHFLSNHKKRNINFYLPDDEASCWSKRIVGAESDLEKERIFPGNFSMIPEAWLKLNATIFKHLNHVENSRKIVFAYEDFILNREECMSSIFKMLDLKNEHKEVEKQIINKNRKVHNTTTKGNPLEKWKKYLTQEEIQKVNHILEANIEKYKYISGSIRNTEKYWKSV